MILAFSAMLLAASQAQPFVPERPCTIATADRITVEEVAAAPHIYLGRCIRISGIGGRARLYDDLAGVYREPGNEARARIGLAGIGGPGELPDDAPAWMTVAGRLFTCERIAQVARSTGRPHTALPPYCRFGFGPVLAVAERRFDEGPAIVRLVGEENRQRYGTLTIAPPDFEAAQQVRAAAEEFRRAVAAADRAALARLHDAAGPLGDPDLLPYLLEQPDSPFAELRTGGASQVAILLHTGEIREDLVRRGEGDTAFLCFCRAADCSGLWPISAADAENRRDRPFACTYHAPGFGGRFSTSIEHGWLPEPSASAFRRQSESFRR